MNALFIAGCIVGALVVLAVVEKIAERVRPEWFEAPR